MKNHDLKQRYEAFAKELKELCERHQVGIVGTCADEGIYGEITLFPMEAPTRCGWIQPTLKTRVVDTDDCGFCLG
jgi:hypothetical protein